MKWNRNIVLVVALAGVALPAVGGEWITDEVSRCQVWNDMPQPKESITWSGNCDGEKATGFGTLQWFSDGQKTRRYIGEMSLGRLHGKGTNLASNGNSYEGSYLNGRRNGRGILQFADGGRYEGEFADGTFISGKMFSVLPRGVRYFGNVVDGKSSGIYILSSQVELANALPTTSNLFESSEVSEYERVFADQSIQRTKLDSNFKREHCSDIRPEFPRKAAAEKISGLVIAEILVSGGAVKAVQIISGPKIFHASVSGALLHTTCPGISDTTIIRQEFSFQFG